MNTNTERSIATDTEYFAFCNSYEASSFEPPFYKDREFAISLRDKGIYQ